MLDDFDETVDDCRIVARKQGGGVLRSTVPCGAHTKKTAVSDVHDLFGKRARLRPKARTQEDETHAKPSCCWGRLLNVPFSIWEARDFFASVGGK